MEIEQTSSAVAAPAVETPAAAPATEIETHSGPDVQIDMKAATERLSRELFHKEPEATTAPAASPVPTGAPAPAVTSTPTATPVPSGGPSPSPSPQPRDLTKAPNSWRQEAATTWAQLPEPVRAEIHKREEDMFQGLATYKNEASFAKQVKDILAPVGQILAPKGVTPTQFLSALTGAHLELSNQQIPVAQRTQAAVAMLKTYGIEVTPAGQAAAPAGAPEYKDPQTEALTQKLTAVESRLQAQDQQRYEATRSELSAKLKAFAEDPAHPHFDKVADNIILLARANPQMELQKLYDTAVAMDPELVAQERARIASEAVEAAKREEKERAAKARAATSANVRSGGHQGTPTGAKGSMDDTLRKTFREIQSRG